MRDIITYYHCQLKSPVPTTDIQPITPLGSSDRPELSESTPAAKGEPSRRCNPPPPPSTKTQSPDTKTESTKTESPFMSVAIGAAKAGSGVAPTTTTTIHPPSESPALMRSSNAGIEMELRYPSDSKRMVMHRDAEGESNKREENKQTDDNRLRNLQLSAPLTEGDSSRSLEQPVAIPLNPPHESPHETPQIRLPGQGEALSGATGNKMIESMIAANRQFLECQKLATQLKKETISGGGFGYEATTPTLLDPARALSVMKKLNPHCEDEGVLMKMLKAHLNGGQLNFTDEELARIAVPETSKQLLVPLSLPVARSGFKVHHTFVLRDRRTERVCRALLMVESPEVYLVQELLQEHECEAILEMCGDKSHPPLWPFNDAKSSALKIQITGDQNERAAAPMKIYTVPNDGSVLTELPILAELRPKRTSKVCVVPQNTIIFRAIQIKAAAVAMQPPSRVGEITIEKFEGDAHALNAHPSHKRLGVVIIALNVAPEDSDGGILLTQPQLQINPLLGMAIYLPSCYPDERIPDLRTEFQITSCPQQPMYYAFAYLR